MVTPKYNIGGQTFVIDFVSISRNIRKRSLPNISKTWVYIKNNTKTPRDENTNNEHTIDAQ